MENIAREAGLGKRTLYLHVASKEAVVLSTIDRIVDRLTGQLRAVAAAVGPPEDRLREMLLRRVLGALNGLAQFRDGTPLSEAIVYAARREPRTPGIAKTRLAFATPASAWWPCARRSLETPT